MFERLSTGSNFAALERAMQFGAARHQIIANNIANWETPGFRPQDVSVEDFQRQLSEALLEQQARATDGLTDEGAEAVDGGLALSGSAQISIGSNGLELTPEPLGEGLLFHDGNDRNVERILQSLTENLMAFRFAATMMRKQFQSIDTAIRERL
jgi:flagellar basal-body rod protein FlgB